ncbi:Riboflavin biosynthesis protein RibF [bacterium HR36]|nr:Riboflavin biosynthesis protein RibF [bacterium HR36]
MATWKLHWTEEVPPRLRGGMLSIGNFDGVHLGHRALLGRLVAHARKQSVPAIAITFDPHPLRLLQPHYELPLLTTVNERMQRLLACGVDHVVIWKTDWSLLQLQAEEFLEQVIGKRWQPVGLVEGPTFSFGHDRQGTTEMLVRWCTRRGLLADVVPPLVLDGELVCSSRVRRALKAGEVAAAQRWLGRPYAIRGRIGSGEGRGRGLGFPTANLEDVATLPPADGVYAGVTCWKGRRHPAAVHIGPNPTFATGQRKIEVFLLDFSGELYGEYLSVQFLERLREVRTFPSAEALQAQIRQDVELVQQIFRQHFEDLPS